MRELNLKAIGIRIKEQRERCEYSREKFAEKVDISAKHCREIEIGAKGMSIETLNKISDVLKLSTDYVLFGKNLTESEHLSMMIESCEEDEREVIGGVVTEMVRHYNKKKGPKSKEL